MARLTEWTITTTQGGHKCLTGVVYGHPKIEDGHHIQTTNIEEIADDLSWARTKNTLYELEKETE